MKFTLEIDCSNAAFGETLEEMAEQIRSILKRLDQDLETMGMQKALRDSNGNRVGWAKFTKGGE